MTTPGDSTPARAKVESALSSEILKVHEESYGTGVTEIESHYFEDNVRTCPRCAPHCFLFQLRSFGRVTTRIAPCTRSTICRSHRTSARFCATPPRAFFSGWTTTRGGRAPLSSFPPDYGGDTSGGTGPQSYVAGRPAAT